MRSILLMIAILTLAAAAQTVDSLRQGFDQRCEQAANARDEQLGQLTTSYQAALTRLLEKIKSTGKLDAALPIHQELEALKQVTVELPPLPAAATDLKPLREKYLDSRQQILKTHATTLGSLADKMEAALRAREADFTKAGKIPDAVAARETREELERDPDVRSARDLLKLGGSSGKPRAAMQLRRYGDNLEVIVFYDRLGKISMDSPVENVREKTGEGKELGDTQAKVLGEFVGAKGYAVDPYVSFQHTFNTKDPSGLVLAEITPEFNHEVDKSKGLKLSYQAGGLNPYASIGKVAPPNAAKGSFRITTRYYLPKSNRVLTGFYFVHGAGGPIGGVKFEEVGKWTTGEAIAESNHETEGVLFYLGLPPGRKPAEAAGDFIVLGELKVEHVKFTAYVQRRIADSGRSEQEQTDPVQQPVFIVNGQISAE